MENNDSIRDRLLAQLPQPGNLAGYREEVASTLEKNDKALRREKWGTGVLWFYVVLGLAVYLYHGDRWLNTPQGHFVEFFTGVMLLMALAENTKYFVNRSRVEILKEVKQIQLQILEMQASAPKSRDTAGL
jgi:hypothetical protein